MCEKQVEEESMKVGLCREGNNFIYCSIITWTSLTGLLKTSRQTQ